MKEVRTGLCAVCPAVQQAAVHTIESQQPSDRETDHVAGDTDQEEWVFIPVPALGKPSLFQAAQQ